MNTVFKVLLLSLLITIGCGKAKSPTGGPEDKEPLKIESIFPEAYKSISEKEIEIYFNKEIDQRSSQSAFRFYPPIVDFETKIDDNKINLLINEDLIENRNYYLTISRVLKDTRNNLLENNVTYTYSNGKLQNSRLFGDIIYQKDEDQVLDIRLILLDQDSITVFVKNFSGHFYDIDALEHRPYIIRSYIDKNNNGRYDIEKEPYFEKFIDSLRTEKADIFLTYVDTSRVVTQRASAISDNLVLVTFSEDLARWDSLSIMIEADSSNCSFYNTVLEKDKISIITAKHDTLDYRISFFNLLDLNNNITPVSRISFKGSTRQDTLNLSILDSSPKNGSTVKDNRPEILVRFDKIVLEKDIIASLKENETNRFVALEVIESDSYNALFKPQNSLRNFNSYTFTLSEQTRDFNGNKLIDDLEINFMVTGE
ncbi:Ig-like domain-containing protein [bacterium]|nr:Ig-like domain-containing protein [bacterium]